MSNWSVTLDELVERVFRTCLGSWWEGTATSGSTSTVLDTNERGEPDDYFQNLDAYIKIRTTTDDAAPRGNERRVTDFANSSSTISSAPNFSAAVAAGDTYALYAGFKWDDVVGAINLAIDRYSRFVMLDKIDTSIQLKASVYEYALPQGFLYIYRAGMTDANGYYPDVLLPDQYKIIRGTPRSFIHFNVELGLVDNRLVRLEGFTKQAKLVKDTDTCYLNPDLIVFQAAAYLHARKIMRADVDPDGSLWPTPYPAGPPTIQLLEHNSCPILNRWRHKCRLLAYTK
jgi:hypothetical protein